MEYTDLSGLWSCSVPGWQGTLRLPGTLDEGGIGPADDPAKQWRVDTVREMGFWREGDPIVTRLTRRHAFEGEARISRALNMRPPAGKRLFVECERARSLRLLVNGEEVPPVYPGNLITPYVFEVTGRLTGHDELVFLSDNSYPG